MKIYPLIVVEGQEFRFDIEDVLLGGQEIRCLVLFSMKDKDVRCYFEVEKFDAEGRLTEPHVIAAIRFLYEGHTLPEFQPAWIKSLTDSARAYMETIYDK